MEIQKKQITARNIFGPNQVLLVTSKKIQNKQVKEVEREMNILTHDDFAKQRNEKQLRNLKHCMMKSTDSSKCTGNVADQILCVEEMVKTHDFVQRVAHVKGIQHPLIILFTEQQIRDIKRFCCRSENTCVLGMDKTYNLGEFHVTPTVFKDLSVERRTTKDNPICFGPTFIHQSSTTQAYCTFLQSFANELTDLELSNLVIGTDEELAFKSAISRSLPGATHILCTRHLKENANRHMENIVGYPKTVRDEILSAIFGNDGLIQKTDVDTFNYKVTKLKTLVDERDLNVGERKFGPYLHNKLLPVMQKHVFGPVNAGKLTQGWTNNNCESANHILKTAIKWKAQDMPKFINTLHGIIQSNLEERCRAIRNAGNYRLSRRYLHHLVDISHWASMSEETRQSRLRRFLADSGKVNINTVVSSDGSRTIQRTPTAGTNHARGNGKELRDRQRLPKDNCCRIPSGMGDLVSHLV